MRTQSRDTSVVAEAKVFERYRAMSSADKIEAMLHLIAFAEQTSLSGIRAQFPLADEAEIRERFAERWYSPSSLKLYRRLHPVTIGQLMVEAARVISSMVGHLDRLQLPYLIGGSVASIAHGEIRVTRDVDFVIRMTGRDVPKLIAELEPEYYADEVAASRAVETGDCFNVIHANLFFQADVFVPRPGPWIEEQFRRRVSLELPFLEPPRSVWISSAEDIILNKLEWYRIGNEASSVQYRDVLGILKVQRSSLDWTYLDRWATAIGLSDVLKRAASDAGISR